MRCVRRPFFVTVVSAFIVISVFLLFKTLTFTKIQGPDGLKHHLGIEVEIVARNLLVKQSYIDENSNVRKLLPESTGSGSAFANSSTHKADSPLLRILVLTFKREKSLVRCLTSLNDASYDGYREVVVEVHIDRAKDGSVHNATETAARNFVFRHGRLTVNVHPRHVGVTGQWLRTWRVPSNNRTPEIAVFVEDDITLSPYFARWLRHVHNKYDSYPNINGYALQAESIRHAVKAKSSLLSGPPGQLVFMYPVLGSWGFSPQMERWREFISWYDRVSHQKPVFVPYIPGLLPSIWYKELHKQGRGDTMWTMWHIYHAYQNNLYTLYANLPNKKAFAYNWKEAGMHYGAGKRGKGQHANLQDTWKEEDLHLPENVTILNAKGEVTGEVLSPAGIVH